MDRVAQHAQEILRLSEQQQQPVVQDDVEREMSSWDTRPLPMSYQSSMHTTSVFVRPVLREMWRHIQEQQKRLDALELLVMNLLEVKKE